MARTWGPWALSRGSHDSASFFGIEQQCELGWQKCEHVHGLQVISSSLLPCAKGLSQCAGQQERTGKGAWSLLQALLWRQSVSGGCRDRWLGLQQIGQLQTDCLKKNPPRYDFFFIFKQLEL